ncbi:hypothetical protein NDU88_005205 [Pleurodeles waltl]|uniref:Uncharacterized protein n=1 Tax=Pleurodeles waltl TaxID=8319 RepID=A0AAV7L233_PLEWA|nr:hypothetical protein NDU88_005205 [Pleurodeles waltl]
MGLSDPNHTLPGLVLTLSLPHRNAGNRSWKAPEYEDTEERTIQEAPTPKTKTLLFGGAEHRRSRNRRKSLKKIADPGELCERAATLQDGVRNKGKRVEGGR